MSQSLFEQELAIPSTAGHRDLLRYLSGAVESRLEEGAVPIRFVITALGEDRYRCEVGTLTGTSRRVGTGDPIFRFAPRRLERTDSFNAVLLVPTGIGAEIGGHAGDATPVATLLASVCDTLVTHPNVVNASDVIDIPSNALYVEGSVISRLLMGTIGLQRVRGNRLLVVIGAHEDEIFSHAAVNAVSAARVSYGLRSAEVVQVDAVMTMKAHFTLSGRAAGRVEGLECLWDVLDARAGSYDAVAISSVIDVPLSYHKEYFEVAGAMINPWGGVEAMLTHALSTSYDVPSAHSPMMETQEIANMDPGIVDPRMAAEAVSMTFFQCILKGLQKSPRIIAGPGSMELHGVLTARDIACLVIPDGCIGLPTLAALEQGISVIAVRENKNLMENDLTSLPWSRDQLYIVDNYWEAAGVMAALKAGIDPRVVRRPLAPTAVEVQKAGAASSVQQLAERLLPF